jgi:predicted CoA-binding protein
MYEKPERLKSQYFFCSPPNVLCPALDINSQPRSKMLNATNDQIHQALTQCRTIAVVGLSAQTSRPSFSVSQYMQSHGYRIIPVNPRYAKEGVLILGEKCYAELTDIEFEIDIVDVFRRTEDVMPIATQAVAMGARVLWQQMGVVNLQAHHFAQAAGLLSVIDRCIKVDHDHLLHQGTPR